MDKQKYIAAIALVAIVALIIWANMNKENAPDAERTALAETTTQTALNETLTAAGSDSTLGSKPETAAVSSIEAPPNLGKKPALEKLDGWLQTDKGSLEDFSGQVRVVQFWTFGCQDCKNALPALQNLYQQWQPEGLEIIGVHTPEFSYEKDPDAIAQAAKDLGVVWPIALDTDKVNFKNWQGKRRFWPRTYVLDQNGDIRFEAIGSSAVGKPELEETIEYLIANGA